MRKHQLGYLGVADRRVLGKRAVPPLFWLQLSDAGSGAVNLVPSAGLGTATFTRATSATCWGPTGLLLTVTTGVARSTYTELTGATYLGYLAEEARTNSCIQNRDFTNVAWTKTNITAAKDQTGIDGAANAASSLLATAGNGTCAQSITIAAVNRPFSVYVKRLVGTGNIDLAHDGASFTTQSVANDGAWHRVTLAASQLNPTLTIRLATNGDKIAVDYAALEDSGGNARVWASTPIATTTVAVTRNIDVLSYPMAGNIIGAMGTAYCEMTVESTTVNATFYDVISSTSGIPIRIMNTGKLGYFDGTTSTQGPTVTLPITTPQKVTNSWGGTAGSSNLNGVMVSSLAFDGDMSFGANLFFGVGGGGGNSLCGTLRNVKFYGVAGASA